MLFRLFTEKTNFPILSMSKEVSGIEMSWYGRPWSLWTECDCMANYFFFKYIFGFSTWLVCLIRLLQSPIPRQGFDCSGPHQGTVVCIMVFLLGRSSSSPAFWKFNSMPHLQSPRVQVWPWMDDQLQGSTISQVSLSFPGVYFSITDHRLSRRWPTISVNVSGL